MMPAVLDCKECQYNALAALRLGKLDMQRAHALARSVEQWIDRLLSQRFQGQASNSSIYG